MNKLEFRICTTAKIFNTKFPNHLKRYQHLLSTFANVCYFLHNKHINVYYYYFLDVLDIYSYRLFTALLPIIHKIM